VRRQLLIATFEAEHDLLQAVTAVRERNCPIIEAYTPYAVHGLDRVLGLSRSRLSWACFVCGLAGAVLAFWFQFWSTQTSWPLNVGGQPWNSLPAFVPVTFESMVLCAGLGVVLAWLVRCRLYPGKPAELPVPGSTDNCFVLLLAPSSADAQVEIRQLLLDLRALSCEEPEL
jgi:hypothetical protein